MHQPTEIITESTGCTQAAIPSKVGKAPTMRQTRFVAAETAFQLAGVYLRQGNRARMDNMLRLASAATYRTLCPRQKAICDA